ncbi:hypothetical protein ELI49_29150 (plasmid) [Rhizobium ruizarguesonis]|uniref:hypothetical protein n=1 Tax=Rhizobium ruizarguesonis TaxID=2081791 RepID=UPI0010310117|nr:hypothetical protein [Rhizobium ruizarguesonis]TAT97829.1 hypothetical protein ELI49_29150 [Rhizobium ruizarguesonis]
MSNMSLKDWRNRVPHLARRDAQDRNHRKIMDGAMVTATVLSAFATAFTGGTAVLQYQASRDALIAADRNRAFEALFDALVPACQNVQTTAVVLRVLPVISKGRPVERFRQQSPMLSRGLEGLMPALYQNYSKFSIWAKPSESDGLKEILHRYIKPFQSLHILPVEGDEALAAEERAETWERDVFTAAFYCSTVNSTLIFWFRDGVEFPSRLVGPPPMPQTGIPDVFFSLDLFKQ